MPEQSVNPFGQIIKDAYSQVGVDYTPTDVDIKAIQDQYKGDHKTFLKDFYKEAGVNYELSDDDFKTIDQHYGIAPQPSATERLHSSIPYVHVGGQGREPIIAGAVNSNKDMAYQAKQTGEGATDPYQMDAVLPQEQERGVEYNPEGLSFQGNGYDSKEVQKYASVENQSINEGINEADLQNKINALDQYWQKNPETGFIDKALSTPEEEKVVAAQNMYDMSLRQIRAVNGVDGATGVGDALMDRNFWTLGGADLTAMLYLKGVAKKIEKNETLSDADKLLLDAWATKEQVNNTYKPTDANTGYKVGKNVTDMVPWLAQFASTRGVSAPVRKGIESSLIKGAEKYLGKTIGKYAVKGLSEVGGAYAAATLMPNTYSDIIDRKLGDTKRDDKGNISFDDKTANSTIEATYKGLTNSMLEVLTERFGEGVAPLLTKIPKINLAGKIAGPMGERAMQNFNEFTKAIGWNGAPLEFAEEFINIPLNALLVGDSKYSDMFDGQQQLDTFLTVVAMGGAMGTVQAGTAALSNNIDKRNAQAFEQARSLFESNVDERTRGLVNSILDNQNLTIEEESAQLHQILTSINDGEQAGAILNYVAAQYKAKGSNKQPGQPINADQPIIPTVDPRMEKEAIFRQMGEQYAHKETGLITAVNYLTPGYEKNIPMYVVQSGEDGSMLLQDEQGNRKWATVDRIVGKPAEIKVDDFVNQKMAEYDQSHELKRQSDNNQMIYNNRVIIRSNNPIENRTQDSEFWFDEKTEQEVEVPLDVVQAWEQRKNGTPEQGTPKMIKQVYGKTNVTGTRNEDGSITVSSPATMDQANSLKEEVEKETGGNATVQAELIPNEDATAPQQFQLTIAPKQALSDNQQVSENNGTIQAENGQKGADVEQPKERKIFTHKVNGTSVDFVENETYDEIVPSDKVSLEKALPALEKKFKDHPKFELQVEKAQVEIPGESKYDDPTYQTVIKSIKIVPKSQALSENVNNSGQYAENVSELQRQNTDILTDTTIDNQNIQQINQLENNQPVESYPELLQKSETLSSDEQESGKNLANKGFSWDMFRTMPRLDEMERKVEELQNLAPKAAPVVMVESVDELPAAIREHSSFSKNVYGVWYNSKVYIVADQIHSMDHLVSLWVHENGIHNGLRNLLPANERKFVMKLVFDSFNEIAKTQPEYRELLYNVNRDYPDSPDAEKGEELLAFLAEKIVKAEDLTPAEKSVWQEFISWFRRFMSKMFNFNSGLLTEKGIATIIHASVQSNFQQNEYTGSNSITGGGLRSRASNNIDGSQRGVEGTSRIQNQTQGGISDQDRSGRVLDRNGANTESNLNDGNLKSSEPIQETDNGNTPFALRKGQIPLLSLLQESSNKVKNNRRPDKVRNNFDRFLSRFVQANIAVKNLLEKFDLKVPDFANVFYALNQKSSRQMGKMNDFEKKLYNPFLNSIGKIITILEKDGLTKQEAYDKVKKYLIARHAPERNEWFRSIGKKGDTFSGMTDQEAIEIYESFESRIPQELIDNLWTKTRSCTEKVAKYWVEYGKYNQETIDSILDRNWQYYVPLRGHEPVADEIELDYDLSENKGDFSGNDKAEGRQSMADDPIAYIFQMANSAIMWGEKNRVKRTAYNLVKLNSDKKEFFELAQVNYMKDKLGVETEVIYEASGTIKDKNGKEKPEHTVYLLNIDNEGKTSKTALGLKSELEEAGYSFTTTRNNISTATKPSFLLKQHEVDVYIDGKKYKIIFKDPAVAIAINGNNYSQSINYKYFPLAGITRFMSRSVTSWRPSFLVSNTYRDFKTGSKVMFIEKGFKEGMKFQARYGKAAKFLASNMLNEAWKNSNKKGNFAANVLNLKPHSEEERQWEKWYDEFNLNGGPTGHAYLMPLDQVKSDVEKYIKRIKRNKLNQMASMTNPLNLLRLMESLSGYGESIARFTAYSIARERGASITSAINEAKEITTNFDSKGELAPVFGSFIMFFNASIQGAAKQFNLARNHSFRYFLVNAVSLMTQGFITGFMWDLMNPDDDDKDYSEITKYTQYNNTVIGWKDNYVTVPLPQGFRVWNAIGRGLYEHQMGRLTAEQYAFDMSEMFLDALSPADFGSIFDKEGKISGPKVAGTLMSVSKPWMDISVNENFRKNPIYKEPFLKSQEGRFADSQMYFNNTNFAIVSLTDWLYKKGGGDPEVKTKTINGKQIPEIYDLNPAKIEYILKSYTGGPGQTILDATNALMLATLNDANKRVKESENKVEGFDPANIPIIQSYYHKKYPGKIYREYREIANKADVLKFEESQRVKKPDQEYSTGLTDDQIDFLIEFDMHDSEIKDLLEEQKGVEDDSLKKALDLKILILRRSMVSKYKYFGKH